MFEFRSLSLPGYFEIQPRIFKDQRGSFIKTFHRDLFRERGLNIDWVEEYYSVSQKGVLRGMHFQLPPYDHEKLVYCTSGIVFDAVVDLRNGSPTFGQHVSITLSADMANMIYIPKGLAHGFYTLSEAATVMYKVATVYAPEHDTGIRWDSAGISWPSNDPIISDRDRKFIKLNVFKSPFVFKK